MVYLISVFCCMHIVFLVFFIYYVYIHVHVFVNILYNCKKCLNLACGCSDVFINKPFQFNSINSDPVRGHSELSKFKNFLIGLLFNIFVHIATLGDTVLHWFRWWSLIVTLYAYKNLQNQHKKNSQYLILIKICFPFNSFNRVPIHVINKNYLKPTSWHKTTHYSRHKDCHPGGIFISLRHSLQITKGSKTCSNNHSL